MTLPKNGPMRGAKICRNGSESTFRQNNIGTIGKSSYLDPNKLEFHKHIQANAYIYKRVPMPHKHAYIQTTMTHQQAYP
jgi:hypothetical protein